MTNHSETKQQKSKPNQELVVWLVVALEDLTVHKAKLGP